MNKTLTLFFASLAILVFVGAGCAPDTFEFDNKEVSQEDSQEESVADNDSADDGKDWHQLTPADPDEDQSNVLFEQTMTIIDPDSKEGPIAIMKTSLGDIKIQLFENATPKTVANFVKLAEEDFYDGTLFHRIIPDFMIQGGDPLTKEQPKNWSVHGTGGPGYAFDDEFNNHKNIRGRISMANSGPNTNGSQFFLITAAATAWLDGVHSVFGEIIEGMDVLVKIENAETNASDHPLDDIVIEDIEIIR